MKKIIAVILLTIAVMGMVYGENLKVYDGKYFSMQYPEGMSVGEFGDDRVFLRFDGDKESYVSFFVKKIMGQNEKEYLYSADYTAEIEKFKRIIEQEHINRYSPKKDFNSQMLEIWAPLFDSIEISSIIPVNSEYFTDKYEKICEIIKSIRFKNEEYLERSLGIKNKLTQNEAIEDLDDMMKKMKSHPDLYRYRNREETEKEYSEIEKKLRAKETWENIELYRLFAPFVAKVNDGHSYMLMNDYLKRSEAFPLKVNIRNGRIIVNDIKNKELTGNEIISVNGILASEIVKSLRKYVSSDNHNDDWKEARIADDFVSCYFVEYGGAEKYHVELKNNEGSISTKTFDAGYYMVNNNKSSETDMEFPYVDTAVLKIYRLSGNEELFKRRLSDSFKIMKNKKIKNLIIDNRNDFGGLFKLTDYVYDFIDNDNKNENLFSGDIYVLNNRNTFSAGVYFAGKVKYGKNNARIIGENTGGTLSIYGNAMETKLKNSKIAINMGTAYFNFDKYFTGEPDKGEHIKPDIEVIIDPVKEAMGIDQIMEKTYELIGKGSKKEWEGDKNWVFDKGLLIYSGNSADAAAWNKTAVKNSDITIEFDAEYDMQKPHEMTILLYGNGEIETDSMLTQGIAINYNAYRKSSWVKSNGVYDGSELIESKENLFVPKEGKYHCMAGFRDGKLTFEVNGTKIFEDVQIAFVSQNGYIGFANIGRNNAEFTVKNIKIGK